MNKKAIILGIFVVFMLPFVVQGAQESLDRCELDQPCIITESTYNDSYSPYTVEGCLINISHPNGTLAVINADMMNNTLGTAVHNYSYRTTVQGYHTVVIFCNFSDYLGNNDEGYISKDFIVDDKTLDDVSATCSGISCDGGATGGGGGIPINAIIGLEERMDRQDAILGNLSILFGATPATNFSFVFPTANFFETMNDMFTNIPPMNLETEPIINFIYSPFGISIIILIIILVIVYIFFNIKKTRKLNKYFKRDQWKKKLNEKVNEGRRELGI